MSFWTLYLNKIFSMPRAASRLAAFRMSTLVNLSNENCQRTFPADTLRIQAGSAFYNPVSLVDYYFYLEILIGTRILKRNLISIYCIDH